MVKNLNAMPCVKNTSLRSYTNPVSGSVCVEQESVMLNSSLEVVNSSVSLTGNSALFPKDSFNNALTKNIVAMLVWLALSIINGSMVHTFLRHRYLHCSSDFKDWVNAVERHGFISVKRKMAVYACALCNFYNLMFYSFTKRVKVWLHC